MDKPALLAECRERFAHTLAAALAECGLRMPSTQQTILREAARAFDEMAQLRGREDYQKKRGLSASRISLVHPDDMDLTVALINLSHSLADACERELPGVQLRFMRLLDQHNAVVDQLPVGPDAIGIALRGLCDSGEIPHEMRQTLPALVQPRLVESLRVLYPALTELLEHQGVRPASLSRSAQEVHGRSSAEDVFATSPEEGKGYAGPGQQSLREARTLDGPLGRVRSELLGRQAGQHPPGAAAALDPALQTMLTERIFAWLAEQGGNARTSTTTLNELRKLLPLPAQATLDAVTLVFATLESDPTLCAALRAQIARLRPLVVRAALLDEASLINATSPLRGLLEIVLRLARGLSPDTPAAHPVCVAIGMACEHVRRDFARGPAVFSAATAPLAELESRLQVALALRASNLDTELEQEARREHARSRAARAIRSLESGELPGGARAFLEQLWLRVLALIHEHGGGEQSGAWQRALHTARQLVDSVQPRERGAAREALTAGLPALLAELRAGLDAAGTQEALRERAMQSLAIIHAGIIHGRNLAQLPSEDFLPPTPARLDPLGTQSSGFALRLPPEADGVAASADWVDALQPGIWLALDLPGKGRQHLRVENLHGSPRILTAVTLDAGLALVMPLRALKEPVLAAAALTMDRLFERAGDAAAQRAAG